MYFFSYARLSCILLTVLSSKICQGPVHRLLVFRPVPPSNTGTVCLSFFSLLRYTVYTLCLPLSSHLFVCLASSYLLVVRLNFVFSTVCSSNFLLSVFFPFSVPYFLYLCIPPLCLPPLYSLFCSPLFTYLCLLPLYSPFCFPLFSYPCLLPHYSPIYSPLISYLCLLSLYSPFCSPLFSYSISVCFPSTQLSVLPSSHICVSFPSTHLSVLPS